MQRRYRGLSKEGRALPDALLQRGKQGRRIAEKAQENVVLAFVRKTVTIDNKEISSADLRKMNE